MPIKRSDWLGRIMAKVTTDDADCWIWGGKLNQAGYGTIRLAGKDTRVHRAMYELLVGPIPSGLVLDHLCRVPACCNPAHLEPVPNEVNLNRTRGTRISPKRRPNVVIPSDRALGPGAHNAAKAHCPRGHPYDEENTKTYVNKYGSVQRFCRTCDRERAWRRPSRSKRADPN